MFDGELSQLHFHLIDLIDILLVALVIYFALHLVRGTRAQQMLVGIAVLMAIYEFARYSGLLTLEWLFSQFFSFFVVIIVVLFQHEIRRGLMKVAINPLMLGNNSAMERMIEGLADSAVALTHRGWGALFVIEREIGLNHLIDPAVKMDAPLLPDVALALFCPKAPLHDGAVVIRQGDDGGRIVAARVLLPLAQASSLPGDFGTRHRAAVGLTEESDAIVVIVSEERADIHVADQQGLSKTLNRQQLVEHLRRKLRSAVLARSS